MTCPPKGGACVPLWSRQHKLCFHELQRPPPMKQPRLRPPCIYMLDQRPWPTSQGSGQFIIALTSHWEAFFCAQRAQALLMRQTMTQRASKQL